MWEKIKNILTWPYRKYQEKQAWKKRMEELRKRDPFIYK
jgi:hypothetical protein